MKTQSYSEMHKATIKEISDELSPRLDLSEAINQYVMHYGAKADDIFKGNIFAYMEYVGGPTVKREALHPGLEQALCDMDIPKPSIASLENFISSVRLEHWRDRYDPIDVKNNPTRALFCFTVLRMLAEDLTKDSEPVVTYRKATPNA